MSSSEPKVRGLYCSISGAIPEQPVVSIKSGHIFEKRLIEQALASSGGKCPETNQDLSLSDLVPLQPNGSVVEPVMTDGASVPNVLQFLRVEWDKISLELHQVKVKLNENRKELASALYKNDAAEKVIAKLTVENEQLRMQLEEKSAQAQRVVEQQPRVNMDTGGDNKQDVNDTSDGNAGRSGSNGDAHGPLMLSDEIFQRVKKRTEELQTKRKSRKLPDSHASSAAIGAFGQLGVIKMEGGGMMCCLTRHGKNVYAASSNGHVVRFDAEKMRFGKSIFGHEGGVSRLRWCEDRLLSAGVDGHVKFWKSEGEDVLNDTLRHSAGWYCDVGEIADVDVHALGNLMFISGANGQWVWSEADGKTALRGRADGKVWSGTVHPDGMVFATGGVGCVQMWDLRSAKCVARLDVDKEIVHDLTMSEKGYYMGSCSGKGIKLWDLRKQSVSGEVTVGDVYGGAFDDMGEYGCVVGKTSSAIFMGKKKAKVVCNLDGAFLNGAVNGTSRPRLGCVWGGDAQYLLLGGANGSIRKLSQQ